MPKPTNLLSLRKLADLNLPPHCSKSRAFLQKRLHAEARQPQQLGKFNLPSLLKNCAFVLDLGCGKRIHAAIVTMGLQSDSYIASSLINFHMKCGFLSDAIQVFAQITERDATVWNAMIDGFFHHGYLQDGFSFFCQMQLLGIRPDGYSLSILLRACSVFLDLERGEQIHAYIVRNGLDQDPFLGSTLIDMYAKCGQVCRAHRVFSTTVEKNLYVWNTMIGSFSQNGLWEKSLELFLLMKNQGRELGSATYSSALTACSLGEELVFGEEVHCDIVKVGFEFDPYVCTSLLAMYAKFRMISYALRVFYGVPEKGIGLWNSMIAAYISNGYPEEALDVHSQMRYRNVRPDSFTISNVFSACSMISLCIFGRMMHVELIRRPELCNESVQSSLLTMYAKCGSTDDARLIFDSIEEKDVVAWGSMISGYCHNKNFKEALGLFKQMQFKGVEQDATIVASIVCTCAKLECTELGFQVHGYAIKCGMGSDTFVGSAMIDVYAKSGSMESAEAVFFSMSYKNLVSWNSLISGYNHNWQFKCSFSAFAQISQEGLTPDSVSVTSVLVAISSLAALERGKIIHGYHLRKEIVLDVHCDNALLDMYIKCGCMKYAQRVFEKMLLRDLVTWNTMISGYGSHGRCLQAIGVFEEMQRLAVVPDDLSFLAVISACSHSGLVEEGLRLFKSMSRDYGILPRMDHYASIVDLLGRAGRVNEAYCFIQNMPIEPEESIWLCLLSASRSFRHVELAEVAAGHLANQLEKMVKSCNRIQLLNLYGDVGLLEKAANVRIDMKEKGLRKNPGCSWIEVKNRVEVFFSGDSSSLGPVEIHDVLKGLQRNLRNALLVFNLLP